MRSIAKINEAYHNGDSITDEELDALINAVNQAKDALEVLQHQPYSLVLADLSVRSEQLERYRHVRKIGWVSA